MKRCPRAREERVEAGKKRKGREREEGEGEKKRRLYTSSSLLPLLQRGEETRKEKEVVAAREGTCMIAGWVSGWVMN